MAINLRQVAALAGVSHATVSRVYAHPDAVSARTRERVLEAARQLGWSPSQTARSLALGRTGNIGLMVPDVSNPAFGTAIKEVQHFAREKGFSLFIAVGDGSSEDERALVQAVAAKVDGIVLVAPRLSAEQLTELQHQRPLTLVNRTCPGIPSTTIPSGDGMTALVEHLVSLGHRRILYLAGPDYSPTNAIRLKAFDEACATAGIEPLTAGPFGPEFVAAGHDAAKDVVEAEATAVIGYNDLVVSGLIAELQHRGIRPGHDIAVAGFDGSWLGETMTPELTSVDMPFAEAFRWAVADVIDLIEGRQPEQLRELPTQLIIRASTTQRGRDAGIVVPDASAPVGA